MASNMGHVSVSELAESMKLEWWDAALADIDRFVEFLNREHPSLTGVVAVKSSARCKYYRSTQCWGGRLRAGKSTDKLYCRSWVRLTSSNIASTENVW